MVPRSIPRSLENIATVPAILKNDYYSWIIGYIEEACPENISLRLKFRRTNLASVEFRLNHICHDTSAPSLLLRTRTRIILYPGISIIFRLRSFVRRSTSALLIPERLSTVSLQ